MPFTSIGQPFAEAEQVGEVVSTALHDDALDVGLRFEVPAAAPGDPYSWTGRTHRVRY
ncbi:MAG: hypothetical protein LC808_05390 [Actinobacteria bacterium]|nr:hypothetical protein [Actinomycetota bacterium]